MTKDDVRRLFNITKYPSICLAIETLPDIPGYVRSVYLRPPANIVVEFEVYGLDEGGDYFDGRYTNLDEAIDAAVRFTGKPLDSWTDLEQEGYYPPKNDFDLREGHEKMRVMRESKSIPLPAGTTFVRRG